MSLHNNADWTCTTFGAIFDFKGGTQPPKDTFRYAPAAGYIRLLQIRDFESDNRATYIKATTSNSVCRNEDILVARYGASIGRVLRGKSGAYNVALVKLLFDEDVIDRNYAYHWLQSDAFQLKIRAIGNRSAQAGFNKADLSDCPIALPPLDEQRRIAEVLRSVDEAISANRDVLDQVVVARSATLASVFADGPWETVRLGDLGSWRSGGTPPKADAAKWGGGISWFSPRDIKAPRVWRSTLSITADALTGGCQLVPEGTLLLVVRGMILAKALPTAITSVEAAYNQDIKASCPNGRASPRFVQLCLQHQETSILRTVNTATHGTKKLDTQTIDAIEIPLPDATAQASLVEAISRLDEANVLYGAEHIRLAQVRTGLMSDLLSGRVRVPIKSKSRVPDLTKVRSRHDVDGHAEAPPR